MLLLLLVYWFGMLYCAELVVDDHLSVGDFVLYLTYVRQLYLPLNFFGTFIIELFNQHLLIWKIYV